MKEKLTKFIEEVKKDKPKQVILLVLLLVLIGAILVVALGGKGSDDVQAGNMGSDTLDYMLVPVDTMAIERGESYQRRGNGADDFFSVGKDTNERLDVEELLASVDDTKTDNKSNAYYKYNPSTPSSSSTKTVKTSDKIVIKESEEDKRRTRIPSDSYSNATTSKDMIRGVIANGNKVVKSGSYISIRLTEEISVGGLLVPRNSLVNGVATHKGERTYITVNSLNINGKFRSVNWEIWGEDGNRGVRIPESILDGILQDEADETIDRGSEISGDIPVVGSVKLNLKKKNKEVSYVISNGDRIYIKVLK